MPLHKNFTFSSIPAAQAECVRRAVLMFGADWRAVCELECDGPQYSISDPESDGFLVFKVGNADDAYAFQLCSTIGGEYGRDDEEIIDLADGSCACVDFYPNGTVKKTLHFSGGEVNDTEDGQPACVEFAPDGRIDGIMHFTGGKENDAED